jgi:hypothetical protein
LRRRGEGVGWKEKERGRYEEGKEEAEIEWASEKGGWPKRGFVRRVRIGKGKNG